VITLRRSRIVFAFFAVLGCAALVGSGLWIPVYYGIMGKRTVNDVILSMGEGARARMRPYYERAGVSYPPTAVAFVALKDERRLEVYADRGGAWIFVRSYEILKASGGAGPKLKEGDLQVPEGIYAIEGLNPNSAYHLSMKIDYPNEFDLAMAQREQRTDLGGDIFIHGKAASIGCLAMGDEAIEELFTLAHDVRIEHIRVVIAPQDFRAERAISTTNAPDWVNDLYVTLRNELTLYQRPID